MQLWEWSTSLTTEDDPQGALEYFYVTDMVEYLKHRLEQFRGQRFIVKGPQGIGKTATRQYLGDLQTTRSYRWSTTKGLNEDADSSLSEERAENFRRLLREKITANYGTPDDYDNPYTTDYIETGLFKNTSQHNRYAVDFAKFLQDTGLTKSLTQFLVRCLPVRDIASINEEVEYKSLWENQTIVVDFPDYDKKAKSQMLKDIHRFQELMDRIRIWGQGRALKEGGERKAPNVVVFWQKEISIEDHLHWGKYTPKDIETPTANEMAKFVRENFDFVTFEPGALELLARYARCVWRWFKKYICICLESNGLDVDTTVEDVKQLIGLKELYEDWKRELSIPFPKSPPKIKKAIEIIQYLQLNGATKTSVLIEHFFTKAKSGKNQCSRMLNKLQEREYVNYDYVDREKVWRFSKI